MSTETYTDDNGTEHTFRCWDYAIVLVSEQANLNGDTSIVPSASMEIPMWDCTVGSLAATWLSDQTVTCTCEG